jgi:hypothetical protein
MMTGRQRMMVRFAAGTGAAAVERHQILAELAHPHAPPGIWLAAGLVAWILSSDGPTRRLRDLLQAWRGSPGQPPGVSDSHPAEVPAASPGPPRRPWHWSRRHSPPPGRDVHDCAARQVKSRGKG